MISQMLGFLKEFFTGITQMIVKLYTRKYKKAGQ